MTDALVIQNLVKYYKQFKALDHISLSVQEGDFLGFLGPNGAGKTTTIHAITGLANFQSGSIRVFGHDVVNDYRKARSLIGFVPQEFNFDPYLTAEQILSFEGGYFGVPRKEAQRRALELLEQFNLSKHRKLDYRKLSGGMKRRLLIARALVHQPKILILDEPTAGVDLELRRKLWEFLRELNRKGMTIFLTTHYIEEAERLCKKIGVIHHGKMIAIDSTQALLEKMGRQLMDVRLDKKFSEVPPTFRNYGVELTNGGDTFRFKKDDKQLGQVLKTIYESGLNVVGIETVRSTLEQVFLEMTADPDNETPELSQKMAPVHENTESEF